LGDRLNILVESAFERFSDNAFLVDQNNSVSYSNLFHIICKIENKFLAEKVLPRKNVPIAILCDNKYDCLIALLASLKTNKAYVPLDNLAPIKRNCEILLDNKVSYMIVSKSVFDAHFKVISDYFPQFHKTDLPEIKSYLLCLNIEDEILLSSDIAYILFTSGSTGKPKGIQISQTNAVSFILWAKDLVALDENSVFSSIAPFQFDLSVFDIYVSILSGARLVLFENEDVRNPRYVAQLIDELNVNILYTTPTVYRLLWSYGKLKKRNFESIQIMIFAGEIMSYQMLELMKIKCPKARMYNFYGPTETNVCTYFDATGVCLPEYKNVPIGACNSFSNYKIVSSNKHGEGELFISGDSIFPGYLNKEKLTMERITNEGNVRWYATGDMVKEDALGRLHYIDRSDRMVKLNGYRIELGEIENVISQLAGISKVAVVTKVVNAECNIVAYVEIEDESIQLDHLSVKSYCTDLLPHYMIPNSVILMDLLPINANSKVDYNLLSQW